MRTWAEKRTRELEAMGETELAEVFRLVIKICDLEEQLKNNRDID